MSITKFLKHLLIDQYCLGVASAAGAAVGIIGGMMQSDAMNSAAGRSADAMRYSADMQAQTTKDEMAMQQKNTDAAIAREQPWVDAGKSALTRMQAGVADGGEFSKKFGLSDMQNDPGYQFRMDQGQKQLEQSAAAKGMNMSGAQLQGITDYGQNMGAQQYATSRDNFYQDQSRNYDRISNMASNGQNAAAGQASMQTGLGTNLATTMGRGNDNQMSLAIGQANASNQNQMGQANIWANQLSGLGSAAMGASFQTQPGVASDLNTVGGSEQSTMINDQNSGLS